MLSSISTSLTFIIYFLFFLLIYSSSAPNNNSYGFGGAGADDGEGMDGFGHDDGEPDLNDLYEVDADGDPHTSIQNDTHGHAPQAPLPPPKEKEKEEEEWHGSPKWSCGCRVQRIA